MKQYNVTVNTKVNESWRKIKPTDTHPVKVKHSPETLHIVEVWNFETLGSETYMNVAHMGYYGNVGQVGNCKWDRRFRSVCLCYALYFSVFNFTDGQVQFFFFKCPTFEIFCNYTLTPVVGKFSGTYS